MRVLLATEGTYPFHGGGVSTWCHVLTHHLPEVDFTLLSVMMHPYLRPRYELAPNVSQLLKVPLWGMEDPAEFSWHFPTSSAVRAKLATSDAVVESRFTPVLRGFLRALWRPDARAVGEQAAAMNGYFLAHDFRRSWTSVAAWDAFCDEACAGWAEHGGGPPTLSELGEAMGLLQRFLIVLHFPVPETDVTHSAAAAFCGLPCVIARLERGTPYLLTEHGVYLREQFLNLHERFPSPFVRWFLQRVVGGVVAASYAFADQVSPVCHFNARWERWWGVGPERLRVIHNGADAERFKPLPRPSGRRPSVASVGLIFPLKGTLEMVEAAALVRQEIPDVEVRLHGAVSDEAYASRCRARVVELGLESTVLFAGPTSEPERVLAEADVVALSSVSEGFPYVVIEAMLAGAAVVATDVGGVSEALGSTGRLVRPRRPAELAAAIVDLLRRPEERAGLGKAARERALTAFTQQRFLAEYRDSYERLATRTLRAAPVHVG